MWRDELESVVSVHLGDLSDRELASELQRIGNALQSSSGSGEEEHWEERQDALRRLEFLASEDLSQRSNVVPLLQQYIRVPLQQHIEDVRSSLSRAACAVVISLATHSSIANDSVWLSISDWFVQPLLNSTATATSVVTEAAKQALHAIFCYSPPADRKGISVGGSSRPTPRTVSSAAFQALLNGCLMKHTTSRYTAYAYLYHVLLNYGEAATAVQGDRTLNVDMIFKNMKSLESALRRGLTDASAETRRYARLGFWALEGIDSSTVARMYKSVEEPVRRALDKERPAFLAWWEARKEGATSDECDKIAVDIVLGGQWQRYVSSEDVKREVVDLKEMSFNPVQNAGSGLRRSSVRRNRSTPRRRSRGRSSGGGGGVSVERTDARDLVSAKLSLQRGVSQSDLITTPLYNSQSLHSYNPNAEGVHSGERQSHFSTATPGGAQRGTSGGGGGGGQASGFVSPITPPSRDAQQHYVKPNSNGRPVSPQNHLDSSVPGAKYRLHGSNQASPVKNRVSSPARSPGKRGGKPRSNMQLKKDRPRGVTSPSRHSIVSPPRQQMQAQRAAQAVAAASPFPVTTEEEWALAIGALRSTLWSDRLSGVLRLTASISNLSRAYLQAGADVLIPRLCDPHFRVSVAALDCLEVYLQVAPEAFDDHIQDLLSNLLSNLSSNKQGIRDTSRLLLHEVLEVFPLEIVVQTLYLVIDDVVTQRVKISALEYLLYLVQESPPFSSQPTTMKVAINYLVGQLSVNTGKVSGNKSASSGVAIVRGFTNAGAMSRGHTHELRKAVLGVLAALYSVARETFVSAILNLPSVEMQSVVQMLSEAIPHLPQECRRRLEGDRPLSHPALHVPSPFADALYKHQMIDSERSSARTQTGPRSPRQRTVAGVSKVRSMSSGEESQGFLEDTYSTVHPDSLTTSSGRYGAPAQRQKASVLSPKHRNGGMHSAGSSHNVPSSSHLTASARSDAEQVRSPTSQSVSTYSGRRFPGTSSAERHPSRRSVRSPTSHEGAPLMGSGRGSRAPSRGAGPPAQVAQEGEMVVVGRNPSHQVSARPKSPTQTSQLHTLQATAFAMDVWVLIDGAKTTSEKMHALDVGLHALNELAKVWQEKFPDIMGRIGVLAQEASERDHHVRARAIRLTYHVVRSTYLYRLVAASLNSFVTLSRTSLDDSFNEVRYEGSILLMEMATVTGGSDDLHGGAGGLVVPRFPYDLFLSALLYSVEHFMTTQKQRYGWQMALAMASKGWLEHIREIGRTFSRMLGDVSASTDSHRTRSFPSMVRIVRDDNPSLGNSTAPLITEKLLQRLAALVLQCLHHDVPEVRKEVIILIVHMWRALGNGFLPYLVPLTSSQRKLVSVYYNKLNNEDSNVHGVIEADREPKDLARELRQLGLSE